MSRSYYRGAEGCLLVYDVLNRRSFADLHIWLDDLKQWAEEEVVIILVGNKGARTSFTPDYLWTSLNNLPHIVDAEGDREVTREEGEDWARENGLEYVETSAKTGQGVEEAFERTAKKIHERLLKDREKLAAKRKKQQGSFPSLQLGSAGKAAGGCC